LLADCLTRKRSNGKTESCHTMLAATIVAPGNSNVMPLMPEFVAPMAPLRPVYLGDDLFACQPMAEAVLASGGDFLFVCKEGSHRGLYYFIAGAAPQEKTFREIRNKKRITMHYQWFEAVRLHEGKATLNVKWIAMSMSDAAGKVTFKSAFVTSLALTPANACAIANCGRARWKIENESFNVLKNNGYHLEHNFGHGKQLLAMLFAALNLLAFATRSVCECLDTMWIRARQAKKSGAASSKISRPCAPTWSSPTGRSCWKPSSLQNHRPNCKK
jgi:hypothetical protein